MIHVRLRCGEHRLLHRCPLRNLLINNTVYVSGRTSLCRGGVRRDGGSEWRMEMEMEMEEKKEGGVTQFSRELIEHDSNKNKLLGPSVWAVTGSVEQNFSVTPQGQTPSLIFFFLAAVAWSHGPARLCSARLGSVDWLQVSICCIMCHHTDGKKKTNVVFVCVLLLFAFSEGHALWLLLFVSVILRPFSGFPDLHWHWIIHPDMLSEISWPWNYWISH